MSKNNTFTIPQNVDPVNKTVTKVANDLENVDDVVITNVTLGDVLYYDGEKWINADTNTEFLANLDGKITLKDTPYNAATNTPNLEGGAGVLKGDMYIVGTNGDFFATPVTIQDFLIAKIDSPVNFEDWVYVNQYVETELVSSGYPAVGTFDIDNDYLIINDATDGLHKKFILSTLDFFVLAGVQAALDSHTFDGNNQTLLQPRGTTVPGAGDLTQGELYVRTSTGLLYTKDDGGQVLDVLSLASGLPSGGITGEALVKLSNADGDVGWADLSTLGTPSSEYCLGYTYGVGGAGFTIIGYDATNLLTVTRRVRLLINGLSSYHTVTSSSFSAGNTTVDVAPTMGATAPSEVCLVAGITAWSLKVATPLGIEDIVDIATGQVAGVQYYVAVGKNGSKAWSNDKGDTWTSIVTGHIDDFYHVYYQSVNESFISHTAAGEIYHSYDGGQTWTASTNNPAGAPTHLVVEQISPYIGWGDGGTFFYSNSDAATNTWTANTLGDLNTSSLTYYGFASNRSSEIVSLFSSGGDLYYRSMSSRSASDGFSTAIFDAFPAGQYLTASAQNPTGEALFGGTNGYLFKTTAVDRTSAFTDLTSGSPFTTTIRSMAYSEFLDVYVAVADNGVIGYSADEGATWSLISNGFNLHNVNAVVYNEVDKVFMAGGSASSIATSTNGQN